MMRGLTRRWIFTPPPAHAANAAGDVRAAAGELPLIRRILIARGLGEDGEAARFCQPKLTDLHDPGLMPNIDRAVARLIDAVRRDELIAIYGDYDVDGVTATAILYHVIKTAAPNARLRTYVPHRLDEGYGINCDALRQLRSEGASVVVSVDCGITAVQSARTAREIGIDLIVTDHHNLPMGDIEASAKGIKASRHRGIEGAGGTGGASLDASIPGCLDASPEAFLPHAFALVHPRLPGSAYPFGELCGAGVAFKVAWRFATAWCNSQRISESLRQALVHMLPLAALGTIADVVPLVGENRIITAFGLRMIKATPLPGLRAIIETSGLAAEHIDCQKVGFVLAPRLNACGRMGHAAEAVRMLTDAPSDEAMAIARRLAALNTQRQGVERTIFEQACRMAEDAGQTGESRRAIVLAHESWHPGVVGIVCSRLVDRFARPAILLQRQGDMCKGSARSVDGYSIHEALCSVAPMLEGFGGHAMAAGLTLRSDRLDGFADALIEHANAHIAAEQLLPSITIDCDARMDELDVPTVQQLHALAPFGSGNRRPTLRISGATLHEAPRQMGAQGAHLQLRLRQDAAAQASADHPVRNGKEREAGRKWLRAVWWRGAAHAASIAPGMRLDVAVEPKINEWNGLRSVEVELRDIHVVNPSAGVA